MQRAPMVVVRHSMEPWGLDHWDPFVNTLRRKAASQSKGRTVGDLIETDMTSVLPYSIRDSGTLVCLRMLL